jgi:hypothetical protein
MPFPVITAVSFVHNSGLSTGGRIRWCVSDGYTKSSFPAVAVLNYSFNGVRLVPNKVSGTGSAWSSPVLWAAPFRIERSGWGIANRWLLLLRSFLLGAVTGAAPRLPE